jgi:ribosomal protein L20A (L18A)
MYEVSGSIRKAKGKHINFKFSVDAKSEKHAKDIAMVRIGAKQGINAEKINIEKVEVLKEEKIEK